MLFSSLGTSSSSSNSKTAQKLSSKKAQPSFQVVEHNQGSNSAPARFLSNRSLVSFAVDSACYSDSEQSSLPRCSPHQSLARSYPLESGHWQVLGEGILIKPLTSLEDINRALLSISQPSCSNPVVGSRNQEEAEKAHKLAEQLFGMDEGREVTLSGPAHTGNGLAGDESPGHNSQYGDFYWDTNGEHASSEDVDDLLYGLDSSLFGLSGGGGRARLGRTQEDLHKYKQRIDASVENQREYSEIIAAMQNKLQEYRKHIIDLEKRIKGGQSQLQAGDTSLFPFQDSGFMGADTTAGGGDMWNTSRGARQGTNVYGDANSNYEMVMRLDEERRRVDDMRNQLENERQNNDQLQHEMERMRREYENSLRDKERHFHNRERNLSQYLSDEQKKMLDLWTELQRVRKQFSELKDKTENDLNNQRNDFQRVIRSVQGVSRSLMPGEVPSSDYMGGGGQNTNVYNKDSVLIEVIRRMKDTHARGGPLTSDLDLLTQLRNGKSSDSESGLSQELIKKYEEAIERNIELESKGDENVRKVAELEAELRRTKERLNDCQNAIRKIYDLSSNNERNGDSQKRARSLSPGATPIQPSEAVRSLRTVLREKNSEIEQLERRLKASEKQIAEFVSKFESADEARQRLNKDLLDAKRELGNFQKQFDDRERQVRRLEDKLKASEYEKKAVETAQKSLETELQRLRQQFEKSTTEDSRKAREEADEFASNLEQDYKNRIDDLNRRIAFLQEEKNKYKNEVSPIRTKYRDLENQYNALTRKVEEKEAQLKNSDEQNQRLLNEYQSQKQQIDVLRSDFDRSSGETEALTKSNQVLEQTVKELKQQRDEYSKQRDELSRQLNEVKQAFLKEKSEREKAAMNLQILGEEQEKLKAQVTDYERQLILVRKHNDELDSQLKTGQAKMLALENEIVSNRKEIEQSTELNQRLQKEKMETSGAKQDLEAELQRLKEQIQKAEKDMENILTENKSLMNAEIKAKDALSHQINRNHFLQKEWEEAQARVKELQERLDQLEKDSKGRVPKSSWWRSKGSGKSTDTSAASTVTGGGGEGGGGEEGGEAGASEQQPAGYDSEIVEVKIKEVNDKWKLEVERLENEKDQLESRIRELEDQLLQAERINERHQNDVEDSKRKLQTEIDRMRSEISVITDKHQTELDEERESYRKNLETIRLGEEELADKLRVTEKRLADALNAQNEYERNRKELEERLGTLAGQNQKLRDDLEDVRTETEKEVQKWKSEAFTVRSELKSLESTVTGLKAQLAALTERNDTLNKTVNDYVSKIRELNTQVRKLEEDLLEARSNLTAKDVELDSANNRLRSLEEEHLTLQLESGKNQTSLDNANRENQSLKSSNNSLEAELQKLQKKLQESDVVWKEQKNSFDHIKSEKDKLQNAYREKAKQADNLQKLAAQLEQKVSQLRKELQDTSEKLIISENDRTNMRTEITRIQQELDFGKDQMHHKNDEYQNAIEDLSNAHRTSEDGRLNALQELEAKRYEVTDLGSRLDKTEQRMNSLQQEFLRTSTERDVLQDVLRRFQNTVNRVITMNRFKSNVDDSDVKDGDATNQDGTPRADGTAGGEPFRSVPFPAPLDFGTQGGDGRGGLDSSLLDSTLQQLAARIEQLQRERDQFREELNRLKKKTSETHTTINNRETRYKTIEENLTDVEDEKRSLEARLITAKQLLRSQEDTLKQREDERRQLKSKMVTSELEARGKEAQIRHLNEQLKNLRSDLDRAHEEIRMVRDKDESLEASRYMLESKLRDHESELQRLQLQLTNYENTKQSLEEKVKELSRQLKLSDTKVADYSDDLAKLKRDLQKAESIENDLRRTLDTQTKENSELHIIKDQLAHIQNELTNNNIRKVELETELSSTRSEIRDHKQRVHDLNIKIQELQRQLQDSHTDKNRADDRVHELDKLLSSQRTTENSLRQQNEVLKNEKRLLTKELDELKNRLKMLESDRQIVGKSQEQWRREKQMLLKKIELLENEKRRTDEAIRETALQREAIEKSLNAMERENRELYKNCAQLQQQIAQLEMENGTRIVDMTKKQREEQEKQVQRIRSEKAQIERVIESRERTFKQRIKQLESQIQVLRDQLDAERRRGRDLRDRQIGGDIVRMGLGGSSAGGNYFGRGGGGFNSVGSYLPTDGNIDGHRYVRSTFASNPLTPPRGTSTPTPSHFTTHSGFDQDLGGPRIDPSGSVSFSEVDPSLENIRPYRGI